MADAVYSLNMDAFLLVGKITKPHGILGEVKVFPYSGEPADFLLYKTLLLSPFEKREQFGLSEDSTTWQEIEVLGVRPQAKMALVVLSGIGDRTSAEKILGMQVWTRKEYLPDLDEDEFFWHEIEGYSVITTLGKEVGTVKGFLDAGGHDLLVVENAAGREFLIPAKDEFLKEINQQTGLIIISPPPGLLELNG